mgnify:CR=1 FL=1
MKVNVSSSNKTETFIIQNYSFCYARLGPLFCSLLILQWNHHPPFIDHYKKGLSEWARHAEKLDKMNDLTQELKIGNAKVKWNAMISLAKTAQLARNQNLVSKGLDMLKKFSGDIQMEEARLVYEKLERDLAQWSNNLKSKKTPTRKEIEFFLARDI